MWLQVHAQEAVLRHSEGVLGRPWEEESETPDRFGQAIRVEDPIDLPGTFSEEPFQSFAEPTPTPSHPHPALSSPGAPAPFRNADHHWDTSSPHAWAEDVKAYFFDAEQQPYQLQRPFTQAQSAVKALLTKLRWRAQCGTHGERAVAAVNNSLMQLCWAALVWSPIDSQASTASFLGYVHRLISEPCPHNLQARFSPLRCMCPHA
jgi:hypothetical protein